MFVDFFRERKQSLLLDVGGSIEGENCVKARYCPQGWWRTEITASRVARILLSSSVQRDFASQLARFMRDLVIWGKNVREKETILSWFPRMGVVTGFVESVYPCSARVNIILSRIILHYITVCEGSVRADLTESFRLWSHDRVNTNLDL